MKISRFEDFEIWQEARELYRRVFQITSEKPFVNDFRFRNQMRASAGSVDDNIAEGFNWRGNKEFIQFLTVSQGSCGEVRSQYIGLTTVITLHKRCLMSSLDEQIALH
jgi:four helix bundle protein